jgi:hypothetical protein
MLWRRFPILLILSLVLVACGNGSNNSNGTEDDGGSRGIGGTSNVTPSSLSEPVTVERLSDAEYDMLSAEDKYAVTNKILSALYKGMAPDEYFDTSNGLTPLTPLDDRNMVAQIEADTLVGINETTYRDRVAQKYVFDDKQRPIQYQLALLYEMPISRNYFEIWMAYQLTNTILFSPAVELDTVSYDDAERVFERLVRMIRQGSTIRQIVNTHMTSQENWRRFRSPEDNTREMMEIFLHRFNDAEVPLAAQACQNWSLAKENKEYILVIGDDVNTQPVDIMGTTIVECQEFYDTVSNHADLVPTIVSVIVNLFFADYPADEQQRIVDDIVEDNPETFNAIFTNLLFSKEFLVSVERPKSFEELFFSCADKIDWYAYQKFFKYLNRQTSNTSFPSLQNMKQAAMAYKLGRQGTIPLDTLSFAYYHKAVREKLLIDYKYNPDNADDGGWQDSLWTVGLSGDDFIDYLFLAVLSRKATAQELNTLNQIISSRGYDRDDRKKYQARIVLDYLSRLSELYHTQPFE